MITQTQKGLFYHHYQPYVLKFCGLADADDGR